MARRKKFYLYEFGDELTMGKITNETKFTFDSELNLLAEYDDGNVISVGQIGEVEKDDRGLISNCLIRNEEIDLDKYEEKLSLGYMISQSDVNEAGEMRIITITEATMVLSEA
ncbi:hypothetical protein [Gracilimonas sp.]|uniref:hypothetical protein n=1 Tax=Gracilimonas sp. TaxID=1974203 RepID=UPI003D102F2B